MKIMKLFVMIIKIIANQIYIFIILIKDNALYQIAMMDIINSILNVIEVVVLKILIQFRLAYVNQIIIIVI